MKLEAYRFFEDDKLNDYEKVFAWFFTKIHQTDTDIDAVYTISRYDLQILVRGTIMGMFTANALQKQKDLIKWVRFGFVNETRVTLGLTEAAKKVFRQYRGEMMCGRECLEITDQKAIMLYYYLLGIITSSDTMFYEANNFGQGKYSNAEYARETARLNRTEIHELLNA